MRKVLNALILLVLVGALLFLGWKARLIPNPFDRSGPTGPTPNIVERDSLRVAVAERPEKLLITSLRRLLEVENLKLEVVEYNPETVWLELASQELDLVIAPLGEAVQAQGRFKAGRFLFFTGLSVGLDQLLVSPKSPAPQNVAVQRKAATDFLARQMIPEAKVVPAESLTEVEAWLTGGAVEAALIDKSANSSELESKFKVLTTTSPDNPMPTVAVLSRDFAQNTERDEYKVRKQVLFAALKSWAGLVNYLESQPELLRTTLKKEADASGIDVDKMLENYQFLAPSAGRQQLEEYQHQGSLKRTLDLLVLSGVDNLTAPDWIETVAVPAGLEANFNKSVAATSPTPQASPGTTPGPQVTPHVSGTPLLATPSPSGPSPSLSPPAPPTPPEVRLVATYHYPGPRIENPWPEPVFTSPNSKTLDFPPALSQKQVAVLTQDSVALHSIEKKTVVKVPLASRATTPPLCDERNFFVGTEGSIQAINSSGKPVWNFPLKGKPMAGPGVVDNRLFYAIDEGDRGRLVCLDAVDGELLWETVTPAPPASRPVTGSGLSPLVISIDQKGTIRAFNLLTGGEEWKKNLDAPVYLDPAVGFGHLAVTEPRGNVRLFSLNDGNEVWETDLQTSIAAPPTVTARGVLVPSKDTYLYFLDSREGSIKWKTRLSQAMSQPAVIVEDLILQSDEAGKVHTLVKSEGTLVSSEKQGNGWVSQPVFSGQYWSVLEGSGKCLVYKAK
jgi:outer membrane protein assembly factor BamB